MLLITAILIQILIILLILILQLILILLIIIEIIIEIVVEVFVLLRMRKETKAAHIPANTINNISCNAQIID